MEHPAETLDVNVSGTARLFEAARDAKASRIVYASSSSVYGDSTALPKREGEEGRPLSPYAASKVMNEELAGVFGRCFAREFVGLRYFNVYGPRQDPDGPYAAVVPRFFQAYLCGKAPVIYGDGAQSRDFTYVADAVMANLLAAIAPTEACGQAYNVAPGKRTTINELAAMVREATGSGPLPAHESPRAGDVRDSNADPAAAHTALGFVATTSLAAGLRMACPFYELLKDPHGTAAQEG
jgi:nucleoside-diphosphate-sugar epimerase